LLASGHPSGLSVTAIDGDRISPANSVRQPFSEGEIGLFKAVVLINRLNLFWGLKWEAVPQHVSKGYGIANDIDLVIGCVDTRQARAMIHQSVTTTCCGTLYWLDLGNNADTGQFVLGQPLNRMNRRKAARLRTVSELFGEIIDPALDDDTQPSCSAAEALQRQLY
jgi:PRTRC genetic system ThiF family protein